MQKQLSYVTQIKKTSKRVNTAETKLRAQKQKRQIPAASTAAMSVVTLGWLAAQWRVSFK